MGKIWMEIDPLSYAKFVARNDAMVAALFAEQVPEGCPIDPVEKQAFLRAMAFVAVARTVRGRRWAGPR